MKKGKLLIIDDNEDILFALNLLLEPYMEQIRVATQPERIDHFMRTFIPDIILLDMNFKRDAISGQEGFYWLEKIKKIDPDVVVLFMTAYSDTDKAVRAIKAGATDFIPKPWEKEKLLATLSSALELRESRAEVRNLKKQVEILSSPEDAGFEIIGESEPMQRVYGLIDRLKDVDANVLITGESGTGKELVAKAIHDAGKRRNERFVVVNCAAIPENLLELEFFGYKRGAFTGASQDRKGKFELADRGTIFLDEIGDMPINLQSKLLRMLQNKEFTPLGASDTRHVDVRVIAATNRDLLERVNEGAMRRDFYYRIHVIPIHLPPLRERKADIPLLVEHFLKAYPSNKRFEYMDSEMLHAFMLYDWPGNVRELQNVLYQYLSLGTARLGDTVIGETTAQAAASEAPEDSLTLAEALSRFEKVYLLNALKKNNWKRGPTADSLGMDRRTLFRKMKDFGLEKE